MPSCCIKYCKSRTYRSDAKGISFYRFPVEVTMRQQWLNACGCDETNLKINSARICSNHFDPSCFMMEMTKPRLITTPVKKLRRLKKDAVPSKHLVLSPKKNTNKILQKKNNTKNAISNVARKTGLPTYTELVQYEDILQHDVIHIEKDNVKDSDEIVNREETVQNILCESIDITKEHNDKILHKNTEGSINNIAMDRLLQQLHESEEKQQLLLQENKKLKNENNQLNMKITQLQAKVTQIRKCSQNETERTINVLRKVFTEGQIAILMSSTRRRIRWSAEDIMSAISLRSLSPKAYKYLRNVKKIPLPSLTTLHNWIINFNVQPGILKDVINILKNKGHKLSTVEKLTVLIFDEVYISNKLDIDRKTQKIYGPHKTCQFIMARGLFKNWRQPIYYNFDTSMSSDILFPIIRHLYEIDYIVVALTCDMGPCNMKLWNELHIGIENPSHSKNETITGFKKQCFVLHPADDSHKIFFYANIPHLLKLARNNFLDSGFIIKENYIDKTCLEKLITLNNGELKICHKLSTTHLDVKGTQRQNVKLAAQLFSNTNALAIEWCGKNNFFGNIQWNNTSEILKLFNDWFDIFNSSLKYGKRSVSHAYGVSIEEQNQILQKMSEFIMEMRVGNRKNLLPFQKGILLCNTSLQEMFAYLQAKYSSDIQYVLTRRLNQDILENFFSYIRSMGSGYDHPTPVELKNRLKWYILGKHSEHILSAHRNTEEDKNYDSLITMTDLYTPDSMFLDDQTEEKEDDILTHALQVRHIDIEKEETMCEYNVKETGEGI